ncbi:flavoprotein [Microbispora sp. ATCC PTA-5024]|uniref:flavoprotein n=1 Tax=Microbispora sp. ATCC PTA-5024 TaxID=316330 RepID=UPI0001AB3C15|nr:flavoprotein [Microbispora sp. ATCC PTA-5024]ETK34056.1 flavoprotein decarboxylase [Microbispora sp. ATCC PTA-5024]
MTAHSDAGGVPRPPERLLLGVSGSVAALNLPAYVYAFRAAGVARLAVVLTPAAEGFLPAGALRPIVDAVHTEHDQGKGHVALSRWAQHLLVLPATANLLGCAASGLAPNFLATVLLAADCPITFVPAMNPVMWRKPAVRRNVATLRADGHRVVDPLPGAVYEAASRSIVDGLTMPRPEALVRLLGGGDDGSPSGQDGPVGRAEHAEHAEAAEALA